MNTLLNKQSVVSFIKRNDIHWLHYIHISLPDLVTKRISMPWSPAIW